MELEPVNQFGSNNKSDMMQHIVGILGQNEEQKYSDRSGIFYGSEDRKIESERTTKIVPRK